MDYDRIIADGLGGLLGAAEIAELACRLAQSGQTLDPGGNNTADLASTGGPSSLSTLFGPLLLVAGGWRVPKLGVVGRPAGGIDVMSLIPGYRTELSNAEARAVLDRCGYVHVMVGPTHAPADRHLFNMRRARGAQAVPALVVASLLAKKLAMGVRTVVLDVRAAPRGNFGATFAEARGNASLFCSVSRSLEIEASCVVTDASAPYQPFVGRGEALIALDDVMSGHAEEWLSDHLDACGHWIEATAGFNGHDRPGRAALAAAFTENVTAQGGDISAFTATANRARAAPRFILTAARAGRISYDLARLRAALLIDQGTPSANRYADGAGVILRARQGEAIRRGWPVMEVRLERADWKRREADYAACVGYEGRSPQPPEIVRD